MLSAYLDSPDASVEPVFWLVLSDETSAIVMSSV